MEIVRLSGELLIQDSHKVKEVRRWSYEGRTRVGVRPPPGVWACLVDDSGTFLT